MLVRSFILFATNETLPVNISPHNKTNFVDKAVVKYFFDNDLLQTVRYFMGHATGSFGLCVSCSLDAHRQVALAARGQTISVAFYPRLGLVSYGSEAAATKAPLSEVPAGHRDRLIAFLEQHDPGKINTVDRTLALFEGYEKEVCTPTSSGSFSRDLKHISSSANPSLPLTHCISADVESDA